MQTRKEDNAFPLYANDNDYDILCYGLSKREYFAAVALQALISSGYILSHSPRKAVEISDELIKALNEKS